MDERVCDVQRLSAEGKCFVEFICRFPDLPQNTAGVRMQKSLAELRDIVFREAEEVLAVLARRYRESKDVHKHLRLRPLCVRLDFFLAEEKRAYRITWRLAIFRGGRALASKENAARFEKKSGRILLR